MLLDLKKILITSCLYICSINCYDLTNVLKAIENADYKGLQSQLKLNNFTDNEKVKIIEYAKQICFENEKRNYLSNSQKESLFATLCVLFIINGLINLEDYLSYLIRGYAFSKLSNIKLLINILSILTGFLCGIESESLYFSSRTFYIKNFILKKFPHTITKITVNTNSFITYNFKRIS